MPLFEDNLSPYLTLVEQGSDPTTPGSGNELLYAKSGGVYVRNHAGTVTGPLGTGGGSGGGALVLLEQHTASTSASLDFTTAITSTYDDYMIELVGIVPDTNGAMLLWRASTDGGSSYDAGSSYPYSEYFIAIGTTTNGAYGTTATGIQLHNDSAGGSLSSAGNPALAGTMRLFDPLNAADLKFVQWDVQIIYYLGGHYKITGSGYYNSVTAVNAFRFLMSGGNITSGTIRVYGIAKV